MVIEFRRRPRIGMGEPTTDRYAEAWGVSTIWGIEEDPTPIYPWIEGVLWLFANGGMCYDLDGVEVEPLYTAQFDKISGALAGTVLKVPDTNLFIGTQFIHEQSPVFNNGPAGFAAWEHLMSARSLRGIYRRIREERQQFHLIRVAQNLPTNYDPQNPAEVIATVRDELLNYTGVTGIPPAFRPAFHNVRSWMQEFAQPGRVHLASPWPTAFLTSDIRGFEFAPMKMAWQLFQAQDESEPWRRMLRVFRMILVCELAEQVRIIRQQQLDDRFDATDPDDPAGEN